MRMSPLQFVKVENAVGGSMQDMLEAIGRMGGSLTFTVRTDRDGWWAVCKEFPAIVTGGRNPVPAPAEIYDSAKAAVFAAFRVPASARKRAESMEPTIREFSLSALCTV